MLGTYTYVEGASLTALILEVRHEFLARLPYELDDSRQPNSVCQVAVDVFDGKSTDGQLAVLRDLLDANGGLIVKRDDRDVFEHADIPAAFLTDLVCEIVCVVLMRDAEIRDEDERRIKLATESADELEAHLGQAEEGA